MLLRFDPFVLDVARRALCRDGRDIHLTPKAFELLHLLVADAPRVLTKDELHEKLWPAAFVSEATLTGLIKELRRALDDHEREARVIRTVHGVGFALNLSVDLQPQGEQRPMHWLVFQERRIPLRDGENIVGRDPGVDVWLDSAAVSRRHARIVIDGNGVRLEDNGSKNGTTIHDALVSEAVPLRDGDRITFGSVVAVYRSSIATTPTQTSA